MTEPYYTDAHTVLWHGECVQVMRGMDDNSIHAICTDPPYDLTSGTGGGGFMGKKWDATGVAFDPATWAEALRVLRPGGHLLAFGGTRTHHRLTCAIEDAGFEIRDNIASYGGTIPGPFATLTWVQGQGFPKSLDVGKALDKRGGNPHLAAEIAEAIREARQARGWSTGQADQHFCGGTTNWTWFEGRKGESRPPTPATFARIVKEWPELAHLAEQVAEAAREVVGVSTHKSGIGNATAGHYTVGGTVAEHVNLTAPATDAARQWGGWGTALRPAHEPIVVARKPLTGIVAQNVMRWGTGAVNVDGCRVAASDTFGGGAAGSSGFVTGYERGSGFVTSGAGRWPSNVVLTHSESCTDRCADGCPVRELDQQSGVSTSTDRPRNNTAEAHNRTASMGKTSADWTTGGHSDTGGSSRFFPTFRYEAKAPTLERPSYVKDGAGMAHPTTKPLDLMRWLVRLVTPPDGTILDMFAGSGTTLEAAILEGFNSIGIEQDADYLPLIEQRIRRGKAQGHQPDLFGGAA